MMDVDGGGTLDRDEVRQLSESLGRQLSETELVSTHALSIFRLMGLF